MELAGITHADREVNKAIAKAPVTFVYTVKCTQGFKETIPL